VRRDPPEGSVVAGPPRLYGLDVMRALVVIGLIFFHAALVFDVRDDYYVKNVQTADLSPLAAFGVVWAMPLLFLTAGLGIWHSLGRRTIGGFVRERLLRLFVPLVFGVLVLMPIPVWYRLHTDPAYDDSYAHFYRRFLHARLVWSDFPFVVQDAPPDELFETGQLWFVVALLGFTLLLLPLFWWLRRPAGEPLVRRVAGWAERPGAILLPALPLALVSAAFELEEPHAAWSRWAYLLFLLYGFVIASDPAFLRAASRHTRVAVFLGLSTFVIAFVLIGAIFADGGDPFVSYDAASMTARFMFGLAGWFWLLAILGLLSGATWARGSSNYSPSERAGQARRPWTAWAAEALLPIYVLHQPVLVAVAFYVVQWELHPGAKYAVITLTTLLAVVTLYDLVIRRTQLTRLLFGLRRRSGEQDLRDSRASVGASPARRRSAHKS
jgi:surface polysaccharide O-acyltransferase-like enzyme